MYTISAALLCSIGCVRGNNEDNFLFFGDYLRQREMNAGMHLVCRTETEELLLGVFDGMGGGDFGERASARAAERMAAGQEKILKDPSDKTLKKQLREISEEIADEAEKLGAGTMGTTAAVLRLRGREALVANVGDSRVYLLRDGALRLLSRDHSLVYEQVLAGHLTMEEARLHPRNNAITRYVGMRSRDGDDLVAVKTVEARAGDRYMICSDGISDLLPAERMQSLMAEGKDADDTTRALVLAALEMGGKDNATCAVLDLEN